MVVSRLESFMESLDGGMVTANLKELIQRDYVEKGRRPTIIIDQSAMFQQFRHKNCSFLYNGQPCLIKKKIEKFVNNIISSGANLTVCLRGGIDRDLVAYYSKHEANFEKRKQAVEFSKNKLGLIHVRPQSDFCGRHTFASISKEHYQVFTAMNRTHVNVANVAVRKKCLAVIGQDSNYLIFDGLNNYISARSLNVNTLFCKIYNKKRMMEYLGLHSFQLPMFATLCGNDIVSYIFLKEFHGRISRFTQNQNKPEAVLLSVAEQLRINPDQDLYNLVKYFVQLIKNSKIDEGLIKQSLDMYLNFEETQQVSKDLEFVIDKTVKCEWSLPLGRLIINKEIFNDILTGIVDESLTAYLLLRPLRAQLYSILHPEKTIVNELFIEEMRLKDKKKPIPTLVCVKPQKLNHPSMFQLYENKSTEMKILRWILFCNCISKTINLSAATFVPQKLLFPVLALRYLKTEVESCFPGKVVFKSEIELKAFLIAALMVAAFPLERLKNVCDTEPNLWVYQLTCLYLETCFVLILLNEACGFVVPREKACICSFYDGKLIHFVYNEMRKGANCEDFFEGNAVLEALFYTLLDLILE